MTEHSLGVPDDAEREDEVSGAPGSPPARRGRCGCREGSGMSWLMPRGVAEEVGLTALLYASRSVVALLRGEFDCKQLLDTSQPEA